jgi:hypothetical protein
MVNPITLMVVVEGQKSGHSQQGKPEIRSKTKLKTSDFQKKK